LPNPAWVSLANVVSYMACMSAFYNNETSTNARSFNTARTHAL